MSRRIEIELTSARADGTWTWRVAGAREPRGVLDGSLLPADAKTGSVLKADADVELEGYTILSVASSKEKASKSGLLDMIESDKPFEAVTQQLSKRDRNDRGGRGERRDRPPRRDGGEGDRRPPRRDGDRPPRREGEAARGPRPAGAERPTGDRTGGHPRPDRGPRPERRSRPNFTAPPELPQRPKPKRLKPGRAHRNAVLADLPEEQRPVAERALQGGIPAVRQAVQEQNARLKAEGKPEVPAGGLLSMAEQLLPMLRVAEWLDRADAAKADIEELDLRDLRSVVAAGEDPMVARDESTRAVATELKAALVTKQESELALWFEDIDAAIGVGRVIRALKLSSQPPKAGIRFPAELAAKLATATTGNLTADAFADRWVAVLEAAAFSPVRAQVQPTTKPTQVNDELLATVKRVGPLLPQIAALYDNPVTQGATAPKPLRPTRPVPTKKPAAKAAPTPRPPKPPRVATEPLPAPEEVLVADQSGETTAVVEQPADALVAPVADAAAPVEAIAETAPSDDSAPAEEAAPAHEPAPAPEQAPAVEVAPVEEQAPAVGQAPVEELAPSAEDSTTAAHESAPAESSPPAEQSTPAEVSTATAVAPTDAPEEAPVAGQPGSQAPDTPTTDSPADEALAPQETPES
ncbi:MAG: hypothetical protein QOC57_2110 [Ilumatobacteraceae bacterium]